MWRYYLFMKAAILFLALCLPVLADLAAGERALKSGDYATALKEFLPLANQGNTAAQYDLSLMYRHGLGVQQDYKEVHRWSRLAADHGNVDAQISLAEDYGLGLGLPQDRKESGRWYRLAADQGNAHAQSVLGGMYEFGEGVSQNYKEAVLLYRLAADQGYSDGQFRLGFMYHDGKGVLQDYIQAYMWFDLSSAGARDQTGNKASQNARDMVAAKMTPGQIAEAQRLAREWKPKSNR